MFIASSRYLLKQKRESDYYQMYDEKLNRVGRYFWIIIAGIFAVLFYIYSFNEHGSYVSAIMASFYPVIPVVVWLISKRYFGKDVRFYPKSVIEYIVENSIFFLFYIAIRLYVKDAYTTLQAVYVICLIAIVVFETFALSKVLKTAKK